MASKRQEQTDSREALKIVPKFNISNDIQKEASLMNAQINEMSSDEVMGRDREEDEHDEVE